MKRAIIIGATSGIGEELARQMVADGWTVGVTGRRLERLEALEAAHPGKIVPARMDVTDFEVATRGLTDLIELLGGCDMIVLSSGIGLFNKPLDVGPELQTIDVNVTGFTHLATAAMRHFAEAGAGHLVIISSIASHRGDGAAPAYNASKAYQARYAEGLRKWAARRAPQVKVTDVRPGFVDTDIVQGKVFWLQPVDKATRQIWTGIKAGRSTVTVTKRWRVMAHLMRLLPEKLWHRL
ncbi:SDR family NAD(P)-dependent oxidoreductase [Pontivivens insulae]|uniref:Putative oxidoreductase n=1 Tax=Pontivivens insulae TaxID=1639689 RepID=A0A2R8AB21_9RHOB|nr:SDR family NAD(P)-dependent oxidoreductase [Pontivivens insulae]RED13331.1 short-subunit dehydrogenase [Pontivivens insulae]SPF29423.1 putative oxidoreductase [Pontivivens insulae]